MKVNIQPVTCEQWQDLAPRFRDYNYRQIWDFGVACADRLNATSEHVMIANGTGPQGLVDVRIKKLPLVTMGVAYVNYGPMVRLGNGLDRQRLDVCLDAMKDEYVKRRGLVLRILPPMGPPDWLREQAEVYTAAGFLSTGAGRRERTLVVDVSRSLEDIRKGFDQKWRNCLNGAEKKGLEIRGGTTPELVKEFRDLYDQLLKRKEFLANLDAEFYARVQDRLSNRDRFYVSLADYEGQPVAGHLSGMHGDTCFYLLGATNELGMKTKASYLLQWHTIMQARKSGCRWYDLGGIDPENNPGVYHFKKGLGGIDITVPGPFEFRPQGLKGYITLGCERVYRSLQRNRR